MNFGAVIPVAVTWSQARIGWGVSRLLMLLLGPAPVKISQWPTFYVSPLVSPLLTPHGDNTTVPHHSTLNSLLHKAGCREQHEPVSGWVEEVVRCDGTQTPVSPSFPRVWLGGCWSFSPALHATVVTSTAHTHTCSGFCFAFNKLFHFSLGVTN